MGLVLPLAHIPIPSSLNPVVVVRAVGLGVDSHVNVVPREGLDVVDLPKGVSYYVTEFKKKLEELLKRRFRLVCRGSSTFKPLLYVAVTNNVLRSLYGELDEGIVNIAARVDLDLGLPSYVPALRFAELTSSHYVWRYSEAFVELNGGVTFKIVRTASYGALSTPFIVGREALVHLLGKLSLELSKAISQGDVNSIQRLIEFTNGLWHSIYGLKTPCGEGISTYVPDLGEALCIEIEIESLGRYP